jgi:hypothetical protein
MTACISKHSASRMVAIFETMVKSKPYDYLKWQQSSIETDLGTGAGPERTDSSSDDGVKPFLHLDIHPVHPTRHLVPSSCYSRDAAMVDCMLSIGLL